MSPVIRASEVSVVPQRIAHRNVEVSVRSPRAGVQALMMVPDDDLFWFSMDRIIEASEELRLPMTLFRSDFLEPSGLLSFGASPHSLFRRTAAYVDKIVNGARPAELPIEQPTQFEFAINLKKAAAYGITIPRPVLLRADRVIK